MKLKRYSMENVGLRDRDHWVMEESDEGEYVRYDDIKHLLTNQEREGGAIDALRVVREIIRDSPAEHQIVDLNGMVGLGAWMDARIPQKEQS